MLWTASASPEYRARLAAVEWACDLFDFSDVAARRMCVSLCDDKITAVRNAASRGLHPNASAGATSSRHPSFESFVLGALRDDSVPPVARKGAGAPASLKELPPAALARALNFALECRKAHNGGGGGGDDGMEDFERDGTGGDNEEAVTVFLSLIEATLMIAPSATDGQHGHAQTVLLHRSAAVALQKLAAGDAAAPGGPQVDAEGYEADPEAAAARSVPVAGVAAMLTSRGPWLQQWLGHEGSTEIREAFAETTGAAAEFMDPNTELVPLLRALGHKLKVIWWFSQCL